MSLLTVQRLGNQPLLWAALSAGFEVDDGPNILDVSKLETLSLLGIFDPFDTNTTSIDLIIKGAEDVNETDEANAFQGTVGNDAASDGIVIQNDAIYRRPLSGGTTVRRALFFDVRAYAKIFILAREIGAVGGLLTLTALGGSPRT